MRVIRVHSPGGAEQMVCDELPTPQPAEGELLVRVAAAGVNFRDVYERSGILSRPMPYALGLEGAGVVEAVGPGVTEVAPGARVAWVHGQGGYADYATVPVERAVPVPDGLDDQLAAAVLAQGLTAHYLTHDTFPLRPGHLALVHAGAGGVGLLLIQVARQLGAGVLTTVSSEEKAALAREAGAEHAINYTEQDFEEEVLRITEGAGVHVVYDSVGAATFEKSLNVLRPRGYAVLYGQASGMVPPYDLYTLADKGSLFVTRPHLIHHIATREALLERAAAVFAMVAEGRLKVRIGKTYPLEEAPAAHRDLESRRTTGKLLLLP